ncbi:hypothetical protein BJ138DRAFT_1016954 [Hygrophoropsis aurantiaca]|uniref:Uncharacterized protein n=1 Tax=Hygrophoropsis aurantiaca TaxID=72124 RepID=A0ACB7ZXL0_9AGAM|nr:hypothetical protein BJ138DRAFT_1016954 [Hygrophoropsis aurantiaca]
MTSDVPRHNQDHAKGRPGFRDLNPSLSPAQAIAEAWQRESPQNQAFWRQAESKVRERYSTPVSQRPRNVPPGKM